MPATIQRFTADADPDAVYEGLDADGAVIVEGLLADDVVARVNDEVEAAVDAADPDAELFNPVLTAFHGPHTKQVG